MFNLILHSFIFDCDCLRSPRITPPFFLCCVCILSRHKGASFEGGYIACLPPSPRSIVTCHPSLLLLNVVHDAPPTLERPNFTVEDVATLYCLIILSPTVDCCIVCLPPHFKDIPNIYSAPPARKPICALSMRPPPTIYLSWRVFLQGQVQFDVEAEAAIQCLYAKYEKT